MINQVHQYVAQKWHHAHGMVIGLGFSAYLDSSAREAREKLFCPFSAKTVSPPSHDGLGGE